MDAFSNIYVGKTIVYGPLRNDENNPITVRFVRQSQVMPHFWEIVSEGLFDSDVVDTGMDNSSPIFFHKINAASGPAAFDGDLYGRRFRQAGDLNEENTGMPDEVFKEYVEETSNRSNWEEQERLEDTSDVDTPPNSPRIRY
jgi:hypothetical protein